MFILFFCLLRNIFIPVFINENVNRVPTKFKKSSKRPIQEKMAKKDTIAKVVKTLPCVCNYKRKVKPLLGK